MEESMRQEMEMALEGKSAATKIYYREHVALLEKYIALLNENGSNMEVWQSLEKEMMEKIETHYAAYVKERLDQGLRPEVGRVSSATLPNPWELSENTAR